MRFFLLMATLLFAAASSFASVKDLFFYKDGSRTCVKDSYGMAPVDADGKSCSSSSRHDVRIRVINAEQNSGQKLGFNLVRPFLIIDGINLDPGNQRTLSSFQDDASQMGLSSLLSDLGYTPVLVQFSETVLQSLQKNAEHFTDLMKFMNRNKLFGFANRSVDGFVVMGISQGGIIGRYGAYKYDSARSSSDAPVRLFASLDSPHQGAVIPKSLLYTIDFWAERGGSSEAEAFRDLIQGDGAQDLLLARLEKRSQHLFFTPTVVKEDFSSNRFLFGDYRKAAEYKGFPSVLVTQGLLKGKEISHSKTYFKLNRRAKKAGTVMGRAESYLYAPGSDSSSLSYNRIYRKISEDFKRDEVRYSKYDFVQGSTYPFSKVMYNNLRKGMLNAMPSGMKMKILGAHFSLSTGWDADTLYQTQSTFIPTASAMDLKCNGKMAMNQGCAFSQSSSGLNFEKPGSHSTATAFYGVDPTHPRYKDSKGPHHIELPVSKGELDTTVLRGIQTDIWRVLCELAKADYDTARKEYRNAYLAEHFTPKASCMDNANIPAIVKNAGLTQTKKFPYARYDYKTSATEKSGTVKFDLAAGWHRVAWFDYGENIPEGSSFEVDVKVENAKNDWMRAELLLHKGKNNSNQLQLTEVKVPVDGKKHTLRWKMPFSRNAPSTYRWIRLVLNSDGGRVALSNPRLVVTGVEMPEPDQIKSNIIYPNSSYKVTPWLSSTRVRYMPTAQGQKALQIDFDAAERGVHIIFDSAKSLRGFSNLRVSFKQGTCSETAVYFDSYRGGARRLRDFAPAGTSAALIPLDLIVDTRVTPNFGLSASRLSILGMKTSESCVIQDILLE